MDLNQSAIDAYIRAANYLTVTQIYLQDNFLLKDSLAFKDIKQKLFGHWGTCPGINFVYAHLNAFIKQTRQSTMFVLGPGHGFPALQANLFLEGTLQKFYPKASLSADGIGYVSKLFSWPYGVSSHSNPQAPGLIVEGGELGYSLSTAYGAVLDNPDLLVVCMIGDGEAETGAIATAWHLNKLVSPLTNGVVLPILHVNGYKISGPTIFGRMSDNELTDLFHGYGYEPFFVKAGENIHAVMQQILLESLQKIKDIKQNLKKGTKGVSYRLPMIILQTPKGWTGIKKLKGKLIEGNIGAHQVVGPNARKDEEELHAIEDWLRSYRFEEIFDEKKGFSKEVQSVLPEEKLRMGQNIHAYAGKIYKKLRLPDSKKLEEKVAAPGKLGSQSMKKAGMYLAEVFKKNEKQKNFRLFSPDETYSNRLDDVFSVTSRAFAWPIKVGDKDMSSMGRVLEMLSEHNLHGLAQGYVLTGRHSVFTTYEAFAPIFTSMAAQYEKFLKVARSLSWRTPMASLTYLLSSVLWRQEHNGFTHQNPGFISDMLEKHDCHITCYFPVDDNAMLATLAECLSSTNGINLVVAGKTIEPRYVTLQEAKESVGKHMNIWNFASSPNPDIVIVGIGDYTTKEALAAVELVTIAAPEIKIRFVNIAKLIGRCNCEDNNHQQLPDFERYVTEDKPVIINFHGYPETIEQMLLHKTLPQRFSVHGYSEEGGTTTPFDMHVRNKTSRYHLALEIVSTMQKEGVIAGEKANKLRQKYTDALAKHTEYIMAYGTDPIEFEEWHYDRRQTETNDVLQLELLQKAKNIAIIGLSNNPDRYAYKVAKYLQEKGFRIIPINPTEQEILGEHVYPSVSTIPQEIVIDIVAIYRRSEEVGVHVEEILQRGNIQTLWLAEGVRNKVAEQKAEENGMVVVSDFCIMKAKEKVNNLL